MPYFIGSRVNVGVYALGISWNRDEREAASEAYRPYLREAFPDWPEPDNWTFLPRDVEKCKELPVDTLRLQRRRSRLPDRIDGASGYFDWVISDRAREVIERFEPARHYFAPIRIFRADSSLWPERYWHFSGGPASIVQALIVEQSPNLGWQDESPRSPGLMSKRLMIDRVTRDGSAHWLVPWSENGIDRSKGMTLDQSAFEGRHIVREVILRNRRFSYFFSDELVAAFKVAKLVGFKFGKVRLEERRFPAYRSVLGGGDVL